MLKEKIINETVETIIDSIYEVTQEYMYESNQYNESNDKFVEDQEKYVIEVIKELNNRINK
jgi:gas vesicle protein